MPHRSAPRRALLATAVLLALGLVAPSVASATPTAIAAQFGQRGSALAEAGTVRASSSHAIEVRDLSHACPEGRVPGSGFVDVPSSFVFARAIDCLVWYGITKGKTATAYAPNEFVTRQQMAVFIHRLLDDIIALPDAPSTSQFADVPATGEVGEAINVLASDALADQLDVRIVAGKTATTYDPWGRVTRAQMGSFIARTLEGVFHATGVIITDRGSCAGVFSDEASIPPAHRENVMLLCAAGVVTGRTDGTYGPGGDVTRAQMSAFLMRLMDIFVDDEVGITIPPDAYAEVYVDRGPDAEPCTPAGADGTPAAPFCTIQAGIDAARAIEGFAVEVVVRARETPYPETVVLSSGDAFEVHLTNGLEPAGPVDSDDFVEIDGTLRITGTSIGDVNHVVGLGIISAGAAPLQVDTPGTAILEASGVLGPTAIRVEQTGRTAVVNSLILGTKGVDLVATHLTDDGTGTVFAANAFDLSDPTGIFVHAPGGAGVITDANLDRWRADNTFPTETELVTTGGRRAIVAAS